MFSTRTRFIILLTIKISIDVYETAIKYETKKHLQCSYNYRIKGEWFSQFKRAVKACDKIENCFGLYDVSCHGSGFSLCINEKRWRNLNSYDKASNASCVHFKPPKIGTWIINENGNDEIDTITLVTLNGSGRSMNQGIGIEASLILFGLTFFIIVGIVGVSVTAACHHKRRERKFAGCERKGENITETKDSYDYDLPDISLKSRENSLYECYEMMHPSLHSYERKQVIQNPYYGIIAHSTTNGLS